MLTNLITTCLIMIGQNAYLDRCTYAEPVLVLVEDHAPSLDCECETEGGFLTKMPSGILEGHWVCLFD